MRAKRIRQAQALTLAVALVGWGVAVKPRMSGPLRPLVQAFLGTALVADHPSSARAAAAGAVVGGAAGADRRLLR